MNKSQLSIDHYEWFDKINGNSYFSVSALLTVFKTPNTIVNYRIILPFQYGYGSQYEYELARTINTLGILPISRGCNDSIWKLADDNNVEIIENETHDVTKKVAKEIGERKVCWINNWECISSGFFNDEECMAWRKINTTDNLETERITLTGTFVDRD